MIGTPALASIAMGLVILGYSPEPPLTYAHAYATPDCAPWDGQAVTVYLANAPSDSIPPESPHLRVSIWKPAADLAYRRFRWPADARVGAAFQCASAESCERVNEGWIRFGKLQSDRTWEGHLFLRLPSGDTVHRHFLATWRPVRIGCG